MGDVRNCKKEKRDPMHPVKIKRMTSFEKGFQIMFYTLLAVHSLYQMLTLFTEMKYVMTFKENDSQNTTHI